MGGLVSTLAGRVPKRGEVIAHPSGIEFEVLEADPRRIKRLRVRSLPAASDARRQRQCLRPRVPRPARLPDRHAAVPARGRMSPRSPGWRRYGLAFVLGVVAAAALPPVDLTPVLVVAFPGLLWLDEGSARLGASFRLGWVFGFGFFLAGLYWIAAALFVDIGRFWWLVPFAAAGLPAGFAIYIGLALVCRSARRARAASAGDGAGLRLCRRLEHRRMGPRPRPDRVAVEPRRLCLVGRVSGCHRAAAERRLGWHLRAQLCDRARRLAAGAVRGAVADADVGGAALGAGDLGRAAGPDPRRRRGRPAGCDADRPHRHSAAPGPAVDRAEPEMAAGGRPSQFPAAARSERGAGRRIPLAAVLWPEAASAVSARSRCGRARRRSPRSSRKAAI